MPLCPFSVHDKTAWLQPHAKTFHTKKETFKRRYLQRSRLYEKLHLWTFQEASARTTWSGHGNIEMPLRDSFPSLKMKHMLDITLLTSVLCLTL